jgi:hypothetical protein
MSYLTDQKEKHMPEVRSNADLSDQELMNRNSGKEPGTSIIDQVTAGFALNNRKKARESGTK